MCKCVIGWVEDPEVEEPHSVKPTFCRDYIAALEGALLGGSPADSEVLKELRAAFGVKGLSR